MISIQDRQAFTDLSVIIKMMPKYMQKKINANFINLIEQNKDTSYVSMIDPNVPIRFQKLSETTEALLALIYRDYLCSDDERKKLIIAENQELQKIEEENRIKYEINFDKRNKHSNIEKTTTDLVEYKKEAFIIKIINKIKMFFKFK